MSDHITPDKARKLLDGTTPGPWAAIQDPPYVSIVQALDAHEGEPPIFDIPDEGEDGPQPDHNLVAAAPTLAELVAGLRYEYAAQVRRGSASPWLYVLQNGHFSKRGSTSVWCKKKRGCQNAIRSALKRKDVGADTVEFRVVRRLVGEPEVVE